MMETMMKIHVNGSILCLQKLPLLSWLRKPLAAEQWECCDLKARGGPSFSSPPWASHPHLYTREQDPPMLLQDSSKRRGQNNLCAGGAPPLSCSLLIEAEGLFCGFLTAPNKNPQKEGISTT